MFVRTVPMLTEMQKSVPTPAQEDLANADVPILGERLWGGGSLCKEPLLTAAAVAKGFSRVFIAPCLLSYPRAVMHSAVGHFKLQCSYVKD